MWHTTHNKRFSLAARVALLLGIAMGTATAGVVPEALYDRASSAGSVRVIVQLRSKALSEEQIRGTEQPVPAPGPGPITPGSGPQTPPEVLPPPEKGTEAPIGRLEGYEEEKRRALEIPFQGRPPGAIQEEPPVRPRGAEPSSCQGR